MLPNNPQLRDAEVKALYAKYFPPKSSKQSSNGHKIKLSMSDTDLLAKARTAKNGAEFVALYDRGDISAYTNDDSRADWALARMLMFWTGNDVERSKALMKQSALYRADKYERPDYLQRTLEGAARGGVYTPGRTIPGASAAGGAAGGERTGGRSPSQSTTLIDLARDAELFHDPMGDPWATVEVGDHRETWPLRGTGFRRWLARRYYVQHERAASAQAMQDALSTIEGQALYDGAELAVHLRVAEHDGAIFIDMGNASWRVVEVTQTGWRIVASPPVRFWRPRTAAALPMPVRGGSVDMLRPLLNHDQEDWPLILAWLVQVFRRGPYPVLALGGEHGAAKSTAARIFRRVVDPSTVELRTPPRDIRDLGAAARNSYVLVLDNLSGISGWLSDALCRLSTGGGLAGRELYTDADEYAFDAMRPVILTSIIDVASRPDLQDRALTLTLPPIPDSRRRPEADLWRDVDAVLPGVLGALLDAVSLALIREETVRLASLPRMADFARWATAAEPALGLANGAFMRRYADVRAAGHVAALEDSPIGGPIRRLVDAGPWTGTARELLDCLSGSVSEKVCEGDDWPKSPRGLSGVLRRLAPSLRGVGIEVVFERESTADRKRTITIRKTVQTTVQNVQTVQSDTEISDGSDGSTVQNTPDRPQPSSQSESASDGSDGSDGRIPAFSNVIVEGEL